MENKGKLFEFSKNIWKQLKIVRNFEKFTKNLWKILENCIISVKIYKKFMENTKKFRKIWKIL